MRSSTIRSARARPNFHEMANQQRHRCRCHNAQLRLHVLILGTLPNTLLPRHQLAERPWQLHYQPQRCNPLQLGLHSHWNRPFPVLHGALQMVHNREMAKSSPHHISGCRMCSRLRTDHDRCFLRRRRVFAPSLVKHILLAEPNSASFSGSIPVDASTLHQSHTNTRISRGNNQLGFHLRSNTPLLEWFTVFTALGYAGLLAYNMTRL